MGINSFVSELVNSKDDCCDDRCEDVPTRDRDEDYMKPSLPRRNSARRSSATKPAGTRKLNPDKNDKIYSLERENLNLKSKENMLNSQIKIMNTKLERIAEVTRKIKSKDAGESYRLSADVQRHLRDEMDEITRENESLRGNNSKLKAIERAFLKNEGTSAKKPPSKKAPTNKYAHVKGKLA
jgi:hypothetical protein